MKLLVISQYYDPEPFRIHDLCVGLTALGHSVRVVTGMPNYPGGELYPDYEKNVPVEETLDGVKLHRCPIHPRRQGPVHRLWNYMSYPRAAQKWLHGNDEQYDAVLIYQLSPVMMAKPGLRYAKEHGIPAVLYCMDLWPESLLAGGVRRGSLPYRYFHGVSRKLYTQADRILISSEQFRCYFEREFCVPSARIEYLPQYAEALFRPQKTDRRKENGTEIVFAGNIGALQGLETVLDAAKLLRNDAVRFTIAGDGSELEHLRRYAEALGLENVSFTGRLPLTEMPALYARADAMLVTLKPDPVLSLTLPGKVQSYLAAGKPVIGAIDGETARVIREAGCGFCSPAGDADAFANNVRRFLASENKEDLGKNARAYYDAHFTRERILERLDGVLRELTGETRP